MEFAGNRTECALLMLLRGWGVAYDAIRAENRDNIFRIYNFSSERKMASAIVRTPDGGLRLYNKVRSPARPPKMLPLSLFLASSSCCLPLFTFPSGHTARARSAPANRDAVQRSYLRGVTLA